MLTSSPLEKAVGILLTSRQQRVFEDSLVVVKWRKSMKGGEADWRVKMASPSSSTVRSKL